MLSKARERKCHVPAELHEMGSKQWWTLVAEVEIRNYFADLIVLSIQLKDLQSLVKFLFECSTNLRLISRESAKENAKYLLPGI